MRSLPVRFTALVVALLLAASGVLGATALLHEREALRAEVVQRGEARARSIALRAAEPLAAADGRALTALLAELAAATGTTGVRIVSRSGEVAASLAADAPGGQERVRVPIGPAGAPLGELELTLDPDPLVDPVLREAGQRLLLCAAAVVSLGALAGGMVGGRLARPLRRLRAGVERLSAGDLSVRVPPSSRDEIGELTRAFNEMGESLQQKERMQAAFGRYVSDYVVTQSLEAPGGAVLGGAEREVTVLFADIRRFTRLSEGLEARNVVSLLNDVFQLVSDCILARGGTIDKFMGDSVMVYFGAPVPQSDHAQRAVAAAIDIQRAMAERGATAGASAAGVALGIGIHTGSVVVGNIGCPQRMDFTAVGDAVNVASRVEKLAEPDQILISEAVQRRVRGAFPLHFEGERTLSGRREPVHVYAVDAKACRRELAAPGRPRLSEDRTRQRGTGTR